jgi:hypothetical protein
MVVADSHFPVNWHPIIQPALLGIYYRTGFLILIAFRHFSNSGH